jgi:hypothetical protein
MRMLTPVILPSPTAISSQIVQDKRYDKIAEVKQRLKLSGKKIIISASILLVILATILVISIQKNQNLDKPQQGTAQSPEYTTLLPDGKSIIELGGWQRVSPAESEAVYAYVDTLNGISISVSEQPLPETFKNNPDTKVAELAKSYNATEKISAGQTTVYLGASAKGPQSVIFTKSNLLVLIKSDAKVPNDAWVTYVNSLK